MRKNCDKIVYPIWNKGSKNMNDAKDNHQRKIIMFFLSGGFTEGDLQRQACCSVLHDFLDFLLQKKIMRER